MHPTAQSTATQNTLPEQPVIANSTSAIHSRQVADSFLPRKISVGSLALVILGFFLPFMTFTCQGQKVSSLAGIQLVTGGRIESSDMFGRKQVRKFSPEPLAGMAFLSALAAFVLALIASQHAAATGIAAGVVSGVLSTIATVQMIALKFKLESDVARQAGGLIAVEFDVGFQLALLMLLGTSALTLIWLPITLQRRAGSAQAARGA